MSSTYKEKRYGRILEQWGELDDEQQEMFWREIQGQKALAAVKEVRLSQTTTFEEGYATTETNQKYFNRFEGFACGLKYFDEATMGFRGGEVTVIAGPSNFGKTAVGLNIVTALAANTLKKAVIISLEMTTAEIFSRVYNMAPKEKHRYMLNKILVQKERRIPASYISRIIKTHQPDLVLIDHLQFLAMREGGEEYERVTKAMATVKDIAVAHNIPIILVSHVSKSRSGKNGIATTADLKGSSAIEQDADIVIMINRRKENIKDQQVILNLAKHRTKRPEVFNQECLLKFDGIKIGGEGAYDLYNQ